jgi:hypothetical protein
MEVGMPMKPQGAGPPRLLERLARIDRTAVFLAALVVGLAGVFLPSPVGPLLLLAVVAALAALLRLTWALTPPVPRTLRVIILTGLAVLALFRLFG